MIITIDALPQALTANEQRVKAQLDQGKNQFQIAYQLHISFEAVREMIFSIRKKEAILSMRITDEKKARILDLHDQGMSQLNISLEVGCALSTVNRVLKEVNDKTSDTDKPMPNTGINEDFEQAVDTMIAEAQTADAEIETEDTEIATELATEPAELASSEPEPDKLPPPVIQALTGRIYAIDEDVETLQRRIEELTKRIKELSDKRYVIAEYLEGKV